jgi:CheY-like chemotaxis protein
LRSSIPTTIEIQQDISNELDTVRVDPNQINQVLINLCTNAAHAMKDKGGVLEVVLENVSLNEDTVNGYNDLTPGRYVKLTVGDTGRGIESQVIERIFEPYFTTQAAGEGSGMGLAVVHGIVKSHGGDILIKSEPGKGTTVHVLFPVIEKEPESEIQTGADIPTGNEKILLIDDEKSIVGVIQSILERLGYQVAARTSSFEALEAFRVSPDKYDLVITDFTMPNMTGMELAEKLFELRTDIPIILCTGFSERIDEDEAKSRGIRAFVMKPVVREEIAKITRMVLDDNSSPEKVSAFRAL